MLIYDHGECFRTSDAQFAYKKKHSASAATVTLKELVSYYKLRNSCVFAAVLDASKAFDRVRHDKLYAILEKRNLPPIVLRLLMDMYERQESRCRYFDTVSDYYSIANGVRQGGVASPILFIVYMDVLYQRLESAGIGCHIGSVFFGMLGYADDIILLATSIHGLNKMLETCADFGHEFDVKYNATKSKFIVLGGFRNANFSGKVMLMGEDLKKVDEIDFLGNTIRWDLGKASDIKAKVVDLNSRVNTLNYKLSIAWYEVKAKLFVVKCAHAYGSEAWQLDDKASAEYWSAYGQGVRRLLGLPPFCSSVTVNSITKCSGIEDMVMKRFAKLIKGMSVSHNERLKFIHDIASKDARSLISRNKTRIISKWGKMTPPTFIPDDSQNTADIKQLLAIRDGRVSSDLSKEDIDERMLMLCLR